MFGGGVTNSQMCLFEYDGLVGKKLNFRWPKTATGSCVVQDQAPQQCWSIRSALQPDWWCNSGTSTMLAHCRAIIVYDDGCSKFQRVCVCVCVYVCECGYECVCIIYCGEGNAVQYTPEQRSLEGVHRVRYFPSHSQ